MFSKSGRPVGFNVTLIGVADKTHNDQVQLSGDAEVGASAQDLADLLHTMSNALWIERVRVNERQLALAETLATKRDERVAEFKAAGKPVDEEVIEDERRTTNAIILQKQSELDAARAVLANEDLEA